MRRVGHLAVVMLAGVILSGAGVIRADHDRDNWQRTRKCSVATLRGDYGLVVQGTRPAPPPSPPGTSETVIGVVIRTYDGRGGFTQSDNIKASVSGLSPSDREGFGTYFVNPDCTGGHLRRIPGVPDTDDRFVIVDDGREVRHATMNPASTMLTGIARKMHVR